MTVRQIGFLNDGFKAANISLRRGNITGTINPSLTDQNYQDAGWMNDMKARLYTGGNSSPNVYLAHSLPRAASADSTFPVQLQKEPELDGVIHVSGVLTRPGLPMTTERTFMHEVGHWLRLLHTFQGGCDGPDDDMIDDSPREAGAQFCRDSGQCAPRDLCPRQRGID